MKELRGQCVGGIADGVEFDLEIGDDPPDYVPMERKADGAKQDYELRQNRKGMYQSKPVIKNGVGYYYYRAMESGECIPFDTNFGD